MSDADGRLPLSDNRFHGSGVDVLLAADHPSPTQSPPTGYVLRLATKENPGASPFHFWIGEDKLRDLLSRAGRHLDPSHQERHQILEALGRIEKRLDDFEK